VRPELALEEPASGFQCLSAPAIPAEHGIWVVEHVGPNAYQKPEDRGGLEHTNDVVLANDGKPPASATRRDLRRFLDALALLPDAEVERGLRPHDRHQEHPAPRIART
jgi:hypothetical protein